MPFQWYHSKVPQHFSETFPQKRLAMYLDDMKVKATLLRNLGYDKEYVKARLRGNVCWANEMTSLAPEYIEKIDEVVDLVFSKLIPTIR